jgi:hypothetical protein
MLIATDPLSLVFLGCFLFGLFFFILTALLGNLGHDFGQHGFGHHVAPPVGHGMSHVSHTTSHAPTAANTAGSAHTQGTDHQNTQGNSFSLLSFVNPTAVILFLLGFGFFGYVFHNTGHFVAALTITLAVVSGIIIAALLLLLLGRLFGDSEGATIQDVSDRTSILGRVSFTIQENGLGEVMYTSPGGMRKSIPARSVNGRRLERGQEVVVVNYSHGIAEVDTWDNIINEEGIHSDVTSEDGLAKLRDLLNESDDTNTELVMRKDPQKE